MSLLHRCTQQMYTHSKVGSKLFRHLTIFFSLFFLKIYLSLFVNHGHFVEKWFWDQRINNLNLNNKWNQQKLWKLFVNQLVNKQCCADFALYECDLLSSFWISLSLSFCFWHISKHRVCLCMTPTNFIHVYSNNRTAEQNLDCNNTITVIEIMRHIRLNFATITNVKMLQKRDWIEMRIGFLVRLVSILSWIHKAWIQTKFQQKLFAFNWITFQQLCKKVIWINFVHFSEKSTKSNIQQRQQQQQQQSTHSPWLNSKIHGKQRLAGFVISALHLVFQRIFFLFVFDYSFLDHDFYESMYDATFTAAYNFNECYQNGRFLSDLLSILVGAFNESQ